MIQAWFFVIMGALMPIQGPKDYGDGEMLSLLKRHEIQVLLKAGFSAKDVAERSGASLRSVRRVQQEATVEHTDDRADRAHRRIGRPPKAAPFAEMVVKWLAEEEPHPQGFRPPGLRTRHFHALRPLRRPPRRSARWAR